MNSRFLVESVTSASSYKVSSHKAWDSKFDGTIFKADWNEFGGEFPDEIVHVARSSITSKSLNWYPDVSNMELRRAIAEYCETSVETVDYFHGSDGLHELIVRCFLSSRKSVLIIAPTYDNFRAVCSTVTTRIKSFEVSLGDTDCDAILSSLTSSISDNKPNVVYLCNPNNPTGFTWSKASLTCLVTTFRDVLWVIDEAYIEFDGESIASLCESVDNLIVTRTLSKAFGLASLRFGYCIAHPFIVCGLAVINHHKSISALAQSVALHVLRSHDYVDGYVSQVAT